MITYYIFLYIKNMENEKIINEILDKINENGIKSLNEIELSILNNKGKLPKEMDNKKILNHCVGFVKKDNIRIVYDKVLLVNFTDTTTDFMKDITDYLNDMFYIVEIIGSIKIENEIYYTNFYITIDKMDFNIDWDCDLYENKDFKKNENLISILIKEIIDKYLIS